MIPTAEEILKKQEYLVRVETDSSLIENASIRAMIEFTKLHIEAYQIELNNRIKTTKDGIMYIDADSILNAYPLDLIK